MITVEEATSLLLEVVKSLRIPEDAKWGFHNSVFYLYRQQSDDNVRPWFAGRHCFCVFIAAVEVSLCDRVELSLLKVACGENSVETIEKSFCDPELLGSIQNRLDQVLGIATAS